MRGLSLVAASGGHSSSRCAGLSLLRPLTIAPLTIAVSLVAKHRLRRAGSVIVAHGLSCSAACGIFPDQGSNLCPLHWQADSQPLSHQGSPYCVNSLKVFHMFQCRIFVKYYSKTLKLFHNLIMKLVNIDHITLQ